MRETLTFYPDIAKVAIDKDENRTSELRLWLLMKSTSQSGVISASITYEVFSGIHSAQRIFGKRQMSKVLNKGEGIFWERVRNGKEILLYSKERVAMNLGIKRLEFDAVKIETSSLLKSLKHARAIFYESMLVGQYNPISRIGLVAKTNVSISTQKELEKLNGINRDTNILAVDEHDDVQDLEWKHGHTFKVYDRTGKITGTKGAWFLATQMPNSYTCRLQKAGQKGVSEFNKNTNSSRLNNNWLKRVLFEGCKKLYDSSDTLALPRFALYKKQTTFLTNSVLNKSKIGTTNVYCKTQ